MCNTMEEIDQFIQEYTQEQEIKDYIQKGIYPKRLKSNFKPIKYDEPLKELNIPNIFPVQNDLSENLKIINKIDKLEKELRETIVNECPICMEKMGITNYIVPSCGHQICMNCFIKNIRHNNHMSHHCCLCRTKIVPDT